MKILVLTVNTRPSSNLEIWENSVARNGYKYKILGLGEEWKGWVWRTQKYIDEIESQRDIDIFILCDSDDLYFMGSESELLEKFLKYNTDIMICMEENCCTGDESQEYKNLVIQKLKNIAKEKNINTKYYFPNGGCIIGYRTPLLELLKENKNAKDDQFGYTLLYKNDINKFTPDYFQDIIGTYIQSIKFLKIKEEWELRDFRVYNSLTDTYPVIMHFAGRNFNNYKKFLHPEDKNISLPVHVEAISYGRHLYDNLIIIVIILIIIILLILF
jgi:hypothetical protein